MNEQALPQPSAPSVTEDSAPFTPPRNEALSKKSGDLDDKNVTSNVTAMEPSRMRAHSGEQPSTPERAPTSETSSLLMSTCMLTPIRSRPGTPARSDSPFAMTPIPSQSDLSLASKSGEQENGKIYPKWSDVLKTPSQGSKYSPSRALNKPGSLHGLGKNRVFTVPTS